MSVKYSSREEAVSSITDEEQRVQYDGNDHERIKNIAATFTHHAVEMIESLGDYAKEVGTELINADVEAAKDAAASADYARRELIEKWAVAQLALSKVAWSLRVDGNEAFDRVVTALNVEGGNIDMRGL